MRRMLLPIVVVALLRHGVCTAQSPPRFERDVAPILVRYCLRCHGRWERKADLDLRSVDAIRRGGTNGAALVPGSAAQSLLYTRIAPGEETMPPTDFEQLPPGAAGVIERWIDAGAPCDDPAALIGATVFPAAAPWLAGAIAVTLLPAGWLTVRRQRPAAAILAAALAPLVAVLASAWWWTPPDEHVWIAAALFGAGWLAAAVAVLRVRPQRTTSAA